jgi:hypothetical protein
MVVHKIISGSGFYPLTIVLKNDGQMSSLQTSGYLVSTMGTRLTSGDWLSGQHDIIPRYVY